MEAPDADDEEGSGDWDILSGRIVRIKYSTIWSHHLTDLFLLCSVCVASIVRIHFMTFLKNSPDVTWIMGDVFIWSSVEPCIGIVCACLPTLQPLFRRAFKSLLSSKGAHTTGPSQRIASGSKHKKKIPSGSESRFHHLNSQEDTHFRPHDDEARLTTFATHVELGTLERGSDGDDSNKDLPTGITVKKDFQWAEQRG